METDFLDLGICRIRPFRREDSRSIALHANDREVWINLRDRFPHPYTLENAQAWLGHVLKASPENDLAIEVEGQAIGSIGFTPGEDVHRKSAEIGYWIGREFWGRGIATAAVRAFTDVLMEKPRFIRLHAAVFAWNLASARVLEKSGYSLEGRLRSSVIKDGRVTDAWLYAIVRE